MLLSSLVLVGSCHPKDPAPNSTSPLPQRAYVWQRDWNAPIAESLKEGSDLLSGAVVLAAEVEWNGGKPRVIKPEVDWNVLRDWGRPVSAAMRVAPYPGPFAEDDVVIRELCGIAMQIVAMARAHEVTLAELQLDFDCAQKKLAGYRKWVVTLRERVHPLPLVITTLPAWLGEADLASLLHEVPRYVLQVHSVSSPHGDERTMICDPELARRWVSQAERMGHPFEIALPTYRSVVGYGPDGKLLGVASDGARPAWPAGTLVREYETKADAMAGMVEEWTRHRPAHLAGLLWYRLPVGSDVNNWRWPTLRAVMAGRLPVVSWNAIAHGTNPADLVLRNDGETDRPYGGRVNVTWDGTSRATAEALPGWRAVVGQGSVAFVPVSTTGLRLPPGAERAIGWFRLDPAVPFHVQAYP